MDDDNEVVGKERRSLVHAGGLKHRAVYCFVFDGEGALILQQRSPEYALRLLICLLTWQPVSHLH